MPTHDRNAIESSFLRMIPLELRLVIYGYFFANSTLNIMPTGQLVGAYYYHWHIAFMIRVCFAFYSESRAIFFEQLQLCCVDDGRPHNSFPFLRRSFQDSIRNVTLTLRDMSSETVIPLLISGLPSLRNLTFDLTATFEGNIEILTHFLPQATLNPTTNTLSDVGYVRTEKYWKSSLSDIVITRSVRQLLLQGRPAGRLDPIPQQVARRRSRLWIQDILDQAGGEEKKISDNSNGDNTKIATAKRKTEDSGEKNAEAKTDAKTDADGESEHTLQDNKKKAVKKAKKAVNVFVKARLFAKERALKHILFQTYGYHQITTDDAKDFEILTMVQATSSSLQDWKVLSKIVGPAS